MIAARLPFASAKQAPLDLARFGDIEAWIFDLDNTLYPSSSNLFGQVQDRVRDFIQQRLNITPQEATHIQHDFYERYGATLVGLMREYGVESDAFLEYVHDVDHSQLTPDPHLAQAIGRLPGKRFILTNGSRPHAEKVAAALGFTDQFDDFFDIVWARHLSKPSSEVYEHLIRQTKIDPKRSAMFEDLTRNLVAPHRLGMTTILVVPPRTARVFGQRDEDGPAKGFGAEVDFVTDDLCGFLQSVLITIAK